jgi:hypothetical protein
LPQEVHGRRSIALSRQRSYCLRNA